MTHHRCYSAPENWGKHEVRLAPAEAHHLRDVLRVRDGDPVVAFDGRGRQARARLRLEPAPPALVLTDEPEPAPAPGFEVILLQAVPKGPRMDWIVEKATELGAAAIVPVATERVVVRLDAGAARDRVARWQRIATEAARQCGASRVPAIEPLRSYADALARAGSLDLLLIGSLEAGARPVRAALGAAGARVPKTVGLLIGPEGDLTREETDQAIRAGAVPVRLGCQVLRVETAAVAGLAILMDELSGRAEAEGPGPGA